VDEGGRSETARRAAKAAFVAALVLHALLVVRGGHDPHKLFGFRPFNESDTWRAEIVRITGDGRRLPIDDGTWAYDWDELVDNVKLRRPGRTRHANAGAPATLDFLARALDWVAANIPRDTETVGLEATVTVYHNTRGPQVHVLRSGERTATP
jgi:hypothetical protein